MVLRLVTWNLWGSGWPAPYVRDRHTWRGAVPGSPAGTNSDQADVLARRRRLMVQVLRQIEPDVIAIQEDTIDEHIACGVGRHSAYLVTKLSGFTAVSSGSSLAFLLSAGVAVRSWFEIGTAAESYPRPLIARLSFQGGLDLRVCNVHLSLDERVREKSIGDLLTPHHPPTFEVMCGDFNEETGKGALAAAAVSGFNEGTGTLGPTMPVEAPIVRIDHIMVHRTAGLNIVGTRLIGVAPDAEGHYASDHLGVLAVVDMAAHRPSV